ncbi:MAG TPA: peptide-methionine (S)-S-oxide reductase MsrA [Phenylobacterium sp.]|nr:peptide-methionine (S)-S-oxide reductase MsrA [Phenylobacterium sp.]
MNKHLLTAAAAAAIFAAQVAPAAAALKTAVFAGGCFWSAEHDIEGTPGIVKVLVGYAGGTRPHPTYESHEGYLESIKVTYDPAKISYPKLVDTFFHHIDPTDPGGQICDQGPTYRTAVFATDAAEQRQAEAVKAQVAKALRKPIATEVRTGSTFWVEPDAHHQDYAKKFPAAYMEYRVGCGRDARLKQVWGGHS